VIFFVFFLDKTSEIRIELEENSQSHAANHVQTGFPSRTKSIDKDNDSSEYLIGFFMQKDNNALINF
jgi:hypothetical protein